VFIDGDFRLIDPELLIVNGCDNFPDLPVYEYGTNHNRHTDCIRLFWWFTGDVEPASGGLVPRGPSFVAQISVLEVQSSQLPSFFSTTCTVCSV
jgi:hypothetical protein